MSLAIAKQLQALETLAEPLLANCYLRAERRFVYRLKWRPGAGAAAEANRIVNCPRRYDYISLLGLLAMGEDTARQVLQVDARDLACEVLAASLLSSPGLDELGLGLWTESLLPRDRQLSRSEPAAGRVVELAASYSMASADTMQLALFLIGFCRCHWGRSVLTKPSADLLKQGLLELLSRQSSNGCLYETPQCRGLAHFNHQLYALLALTENYPSELESAVVAAGRKLAQQFLQLQDAAGAWWWLCEPRSGRRVGRYPIYGVHQDGMGPLGLLAIHRRFPDILPNVELRRRLAASFGCLFDLGLAKTDTGELWRSVRCRPRVYRRRLVRFVVQVPWLLRLERFLPKEINREIRPYHIGWFFCCYPEVMQVFRDGNGEEGRA